MEPPATPMRLTFDFICEHPEDLEEVVPCEGQFFVDIWCAECPHSAIRYVDEESLE